jgi:hypothetical protein
MACLVASGRLDERDGLNPTRALILQGYYALRRSYAPTQIGTPQVAAWIKHYEPDEALPSDALIQMTLANAKVPHRPPGRPRVHVYRPNIAQARVCSPPPAWVGDLYRDGQVPAQVNAEPDRRGGAAYRASG